MNASSRFLCLLYITTSAGLACTAAITFGRGSVWMTCSFVAASTVPLIAVIRENVIGGQRRHLVDEARRKDRGKAAVAWVRDELDAACCERWWTSLGRDHDAVCRQLPGRSAA